MAKRASVEEVAKFYEELRGGANDTQADKLKATAKYFGIKPTTVKNHLKFWWPGQKYLKEFAADGRRGGKAKWDRPIKELVDALNKHQTVAATAKALKTTPITLTKRIKEKEIAQVWVAQK